VTLSPVSISSIEELMPLMELRDVVFYRVLAEHIVTADSKESSEEPVDLAVKVDERHDQSRIEVPPSARAAIAVADELNSPGR
jgi:hypothetical protein